MDIVVTEGTGLESSNYQPFHDQNLGIANRSALMLQKALKSTGSSSIIKNAKKWDIKIIECKEILKLMKTTPLLPKKTHELKSKKSIMKLKSAFIKMEDRSRTYRPEFAMWNSFPYLDLNTVGCTSPFQTWFQKEHAEGKK